MSDGSGTHQAALSKSRNKKRAGLSDQQQDQEQEKRDREQGSADREQEKRDREQSGATRSRKNEIREQEHAEHVSELYRPTGARISTRPLRPGGGQIRGTRDAQRPAKRTQRSYWKRTRKTAWANAKPLGHHRRSETSLFAEPLAKDASALEIDVRQPHGKRLSGNASDDDLKMAGDSGADEQRPGTRMRCWRKC